MIQLKSVPKFCTTFAEIEIIGTQLKLLPCPCCRLYGFLIFHGWLTGYCVSSSDKERRGKRLFCSNRNCKKGCGKTFSIFLSDIIIKFRINTKTLWEFLSIKTTDFTTTSNSFFLSTMHFTVSTAYRLWKRFILRQSFLRDTLFSTEIAPPDCNSGSPFMQTIKHLISFFPKTLNPISNFQIYFQKPFL